jgi:glyoxylase I family protein
MVMKGMIDHILINCIDRERALPFYSWLLPKLGFRTQVALPDNPLVVGWIGRNTNVWLNVADESLRDQPFDRRRVGLRELAFAADTREEVDEIARGIESHGGAVIDAPQDYPYWPGYYSVFFTDPDGIKLEVVLNPQHLPK